MPLTDKGERILGSMKQTYGSTEKAKQVLYASKNKGTITGVDAQATTASAPSSGPGGQRGAQPAVPRWTGKVV